MVREFLVYSMFLALIFVGVVGHYMFNRSDINSQTQKIAQLTSIVEPSLGVGALENRLLILDKSSDNSVYPDVLAINSAGFVYAK